MAASNPTTPQTKRSEDSMSTNSSQILQDRINKEMLNNQIKLNLSCSEVNDLRASLFTSNTSLLTQENIGKKKIQEKEDNLKSKFRSINELEANIADMERELATVAAATVIAKQKLLAKKQDLKSSIDELVRLHKLMECLSKEICNKIEQFQQQLSDFEAERLRIMEDSSLSSEERERLLAELNEKVIKLKECHKSAIALLESKRAELKTQSKEYTSNINMLAMDITRKHNDELAHLEAMKMGKTPSECERIDEQIRRLQDKFEEEISHLPDSKMKTEYFQDENGRYYIREDGTKIYKNDSIASEYILNDGVWQKITDKMTILMDDIGDYYLDESGEKVYIRKCSQDSMGRFYIDSQGRKIYRAGPNTSEYMLVNGILIRLNTDIIDEDDADEMDKLRLGKKIFYQQIIIIYSDNFF